MKHVLDLYRQLGRRPVGFPLATEVESHLRIGGYGFGEYGVGKMEAVLMAVICMALLPRDRRGET